MISCRGGAIPGADKKEIGSLTGGSGKYYASIRSTFGERVDGMREHLQSASFMSFQFYLYILHILQFPAKKKKSGEGDESGMREN